ncbi:MAG TPA: HAD family hydrolase [Acidimicrobiia bacterium]|nr:HAD family hydrolase [Acidimicrobiia bacterium]
MIKAVAFDIGETLIDETRIWSRWADRLGVPRLTFLGVLGALAALDRPHREVFDFFRPGFDLDSELERWAAEEPDGLRENFDEADLYPDVPGCLARLLDRGLKVVVAGNQPVQARLALERMDLGVAAILVSAEIGAEKPSPAFFRRVVEACGVAPNEILYVGDRLDNDVLPARAAGLRTVLLKRGPWGYLHAERPEAAAADQVIDSLDRLAT